MVIQSLVAVLVDDQSPWHFYVLNYFLGFGILGKFLAGMYVNACGMFSAHSMTLLSLELKGQLTPLTDLRAMFRRLENPSKEEIKQFTFFLRFMPYMALVSSLMTSMPLTCLGFVGAVVTGYKFHGMMFALYCTPVLVIIAVIIHFNGAVFIFVHLIIAQSTSYFKIRLNRVDKKLKEFANQSLNPIRRQSVEEGILKQKETKRTMFVDEVVLDLQETLDELKEHNQLIKHFLRDELYGLAACLISILVFVLGDHPWYYKAFLCVTLVFVGVFNAVSFINAAQLYVRILNLSKALFSCQCLARNQSIQTRPRSTPSTSQGTRLSMDVRVLKSKFQVLRMIQRVSSPHLRIGYTVGNGESFSDDTAAAYVSNIFGNTLMFLNAIH